MRRIISLLIIAIVFTTNIVAQQLKVDPHFWWSGMQETELQLLIHGDNIASFKADIMTNNITLKETVTLDSPNYIILCLDLTNSKPEKFDIVFTNGKKKITTNYELKAR